MDNLQTQFLDLAHTGSARMKNRNPFFRKTKWTTRRMTEAEEAEAIREVAESGDSSDQDKLADYFYKQGNLTAYVELLCRAAKLGDSEAQKKLNDEIDDGDDPETIAILYESTMRELSLEDDEWHRDADARWYKNEGEQCFEAIIDMSQALEIG